MKTIILKSTLFAVFAACILSSCVKDDNYSTPTLDSNCIETTLVKNKELSQLIINPTASLYTGNDVIEAYVTSSDVAGNFYKSVSFQTLDKTKAFSVPVDASSTFINFEPGRKVLINMKDLYTDIKYGGIRFGGLFNNNGTAEVGRLPLAQFAKSINRSCVKVDESQLVKKLTIAEATTDANLNFLIDLENVQFTNDDINSTYYDSTRDIGGATNHLIQNKAGTTVICRISSFSNFAGKTVNPKSGTIRGVMSKYNNDYQFTVRSESDFNLTKNRFDALINESFTSGFPNWNNFSVVGDQVWTLDTQFGFPGSCAKISGYAGSNFANEDWLISPPQNMSGFTTLSMAFDNAYKFTGNPIQVLISNNYSGSGSPYLAGVNWTNLSTTSTPPIVLSSGNYIWANSGWININGFTGAGNSSVYIAFKYTSTSSVGSTWEIDNLKFKE
jgi:hypothetical protein